MKKIVSFVLSFAPAGLWACGQGMECGMHGGASALKTPIYLLMLGFGYWILRIAEKEAHKNVKLIGRTIAAVILLSSVFGLLCPLLFSCGSHKSGGAATTCVYEGGKSGGCPFMPRGESTIAPAAPDQKPAEKK